MVAGVLCLALLILLVGLTYAPGVRITTITVLGTKTVAAQVLQAEAQKELSGSYAGVFPKNSIFFYPKRTLESNLLSLYPTLKQISIQATSFSSISLIAVDREPRAVWCPQHGGQCLYLDEDGVAYAEAPQDGGGFVVYQGGVVGSLPWQFLTPDQFHALASLIDALGATQPQDPIVRVIVDQNLDVHAAFAQNFVLIFSLADQGGDTFERFKLALTAEPFRNHALSDFEYLDLRFGDKLYYKLKGS
jgi:hypothetical protein